MGTNVKTAFSSARKPNHFDPVTKLLRHRYVDIADSGDPLPVNKVRIDEPSECERRQDGDLVSYVESLHIIGWIGLSEAEFLCRLQCVIERLPALLHRGQNVVGGSVQNSRDAGYLIGLKPSLNGRNQRNAAAHRCLK